MIHDFQEKLQCTEEEEDNVIEAEGDMTGSDIQNMQEEEVDNDGLDFHTHHRVPDMVCVSLNCSV